MAWTDDRLEDNGQDLTLQVFHPQTSDTPIVQTAPFVVHGPPIVTIKPDSTDIIVNADFLGRCNVSSSLNSYSTKWYKGNTEISSSAKFTITGDFLAITSVQFSDEGDYSCTATNAAGTSLRSNAVAISVISEGGAPAISGAVSTPNENDILILRCTSVGGVPTPSVIWMKNGVNMNIGDTSVTENGVTTTTSVWTYQVAYADRNADFTCLVSNSVGDITRTKIFTAVYIPPTTVANPIRGPTTTVAGEVTTFSINFARVSPAPIVSWSIGGLQLPSNVPPIITVPTAEGAFNATASITFTQFAEYNDKALVASVNHAQSRIVFDVSATLTVKSQPSQPVIDGLPLTRIGVDGDTYQLECKTIGGFPVPTLGWFRNGQPILTSPSTDFNADPIVTTATYNMAVTLSEKNAVFRCTAYNEINTLYTSVSLTDVYVKAYLTISGSSDVISGKNTSMSCTSTTSRPVPSVAWLMVDSADVSTSLPVKEESVGQPDNIGLVAVTSTVYFVPTIADNRKTIRCISAQSGLTHSHTSSNIITVHGPPTVFAAYNATAKNGTTVNFTCSVTSSLASYNVTWYKRVSDTDGTAIPVQINERYAVDLSPHRLWIYDINVNDNGVYYCIAQSAAGTSARSEVSLIVNIPQAVPWFENNVTARTVNENEGSITAKCLTTVYPGNTGIL
ncbi:hemicentin-1-like [Pecten maximus]|uniref:hemicentin-1-like n=1 Tax=Pecten maximus TaxID=6579 RepID=UPI001457F335|nr:hemicentin-1-like [Pecten maximus]